MCSLTISFPYDITVDQRCQFVKNKSYIYGLTLEEYYPGMEKYVYDIQFFPLNISYGKNCICHFSFFFRVIQINICLTWLHLPTLILFCHDIIFNWFLRWGWLFVYSFCLVFIDHGGRPNKSTMKSDMIMGCNNRFK